MEGKHILLNGDRGVGKSTLIRRLLAENERPVYGFFTKKLAADKTGFHPIYIHPAGRPAEARAHTDENLIGTCDTVTHNIELDVFNTLGVRYLAEARPGGLIVMDELGFMEAEAEAFVQAVFTALDGEIPVIAAVKTRYDVPFLNAVRAHKNARVYDVTADTRDALYTELCEVVRAWNAR